MLQFDILYCMCVCLELYVITLLHFFKLLDTDDDQPTMLLTVREYLHTEDWFRLFSGSFGTQQDYH